MTLQEIIDAHERRQMPEICPILTPRGEACVQVVRLGYELRELCPSDRVRTSSAGSAPCSTI